jgi:hypothetical protein
MTGTTRALIALERRAEDAWQTAKEHPTPAGLNYASGLTRAMETLAEEIPWPATSLAYWHNRREEIRQAIIAERAARNAAERAAADAQAAHERCDAVGPGTCDAGHFLAEDCPCCEANHPAEEARS